MPYYPELMPANTPKIDYWRITVPFANLNL